MVNVKTFFSSQIPKLGMGPMSNAQLKFRDDDIRAWECSEHLPLKPETIDFTS